MEMKNLEALTAIALLVLASATITYSPSVTLAYTNAAPVQQTAGASVGVNEYISFTITDILGGGITFGDLNPGTNDNPASPNPAVNLIVAKETNIPVYIRLKGDDFTGPAVLGIGNVTYNNTNTVGGSIQLNTTYGAVWWTFPNTNTDQNVDVYYWIDIPSDQAAGDYSTTFYFQAARA